MSAFHVESDVLQRALVIERHSDVLETQDRRALYRFTKIRVMNTFSTKIHTDAMTTA